MDEHLKDIYRLLTAAKRGIGVSDFSLSVMGADALEITRERWAAYIRMLAEDGYLGGVRVYRNILGETKVEDKGVHITLKGLQYLQENSVMQQLYKAAKGITDLIP